MKRKIKFRVWCHKNRKFLEDFTYPNGHSGLFLQVLTGELKDIQSSIDEDGCADVCYKDFNPEYYDLVIQQYTGFCDKNKKQVYEDDIVKMDGKNYQVMYFSNYGMFGLVGRNKYYPVGSDVDESKPMGSTGSSTHYKPYVLNEYYQKRIEVVGNIYENSDLLK